MMPSSISQISLISLTNLRRTTKADLEPFGCWALSLLFVWLQQLVQVWVQVWQLSASRPHPRHPALPPYRPSVHLSPPRNLSHRPTAHLSPSRCPPISPRLRRHQPHFHLQAVLPPTARPTLRPINPKRRLIPWGNGKFPAHPSPSRSSATLISAKRVRS